MTRQHLALLVGGALPAILLGISSAGQKLSAMAGTAPGVFLIVTGLVTTVVGAAFCVGDQDWKWSASGAGYACLFGLCWAAATGFVSLALKKFDAQISQLVPLYNMNTLVAVMIGLIVFAEWRTIHPGKILTAAALIIAGGVIASKA
ncbi:glucose uptake protein [Roseimicrobium gellanilyticum]|uniref:Glucose uptake protein n=1 Tax=Roseimicrobium gellanilyticum TaxID=748857 RepID=A0A366HQC5_9BACT|nr:hypothetical protein [Roseimicrobium gellanilyticum]RBP45133.1 glucose uptake protein [Roseimicrobium gellanilyticum]